MSSRARRAALLQSSNRSSDNHTVKTASAVSRGMHAHCTGSHDKTAHKAPQQLCPQSWHTSMQHPTEAAERGDDAQRRRTSSDFEGGTSWHSLLLDGAWPADCPSQRYGTNPVHGKRQYLVSQVGCSTAKSLQEYMARGHCRAADMPGCVGWTGGSSRGSRVACAQTRY